MMRGKKMPAGVGSRGGLVREILHHEIVTQLGTARVGDVLLLGAAALGDIGQHFPDTDDTYKGISSMVLLEKVRDLLAENFFSIANVDMTIMAQRPRIGPHIEAMRDNIAEVLGIGTSRVNVKATTTERLGFVGREEGIAAEAICSIYR